MSLMAPRTPAEAVFQYCNYGYDPNKYTSGFDCVKKRCAEIGLEPGGLGCIDPDVQGLGVGGGDERFAQKTRREIDLKSKNEKIMLLGGAVIGLWAISKGLSLIKYLAIGTAGYLAYKEYKKRERTRNIIKY